MIIITIENIKQILKERSNKLYSFFPIYLFLAIYRAAVIIVKNQKEFITNSTSTFKY